MMAKEKKPDENLEELIESLIEKRSGIGLLQSTPEISELYEVLNKFMGGGEDIDLRSEILKPREFSVLSVIKDYADGFNLANASHILERFRVVYLRNMFSRNRASRVEMVEILKAMNDKLDNPEEFID